MQETLIGARVMPHSLEAEQSVLGSMKKVKSNPELLLSLDLKNL